MSFSIFKTYWTEVSPRVAAQLAIANGVPKAQVEIWSFNIKTKGE